MSLELEQNILRLEEVLAELRDVVIERRINLIETGLSELRDTIRESHTTLKDLKSERKEIEKLLTLLAIKLREWIQEVIDEERSSEIPKLCDKKLHFKGEECSTKNCSWNYHWTKDGQAFAKPDLCDNRHFIGVECLTKNCSWNH